MKVVSLITITVLFVCFNSIECERSSYTVPQPIVEIFRPKGLRVSIPHEQGIRLFAFHGAVNRDLQYEEAGDMSEDILKKKNGRWYFEDRLRRLNKGDVLNFWLFVIKNNLGYRLNDQSFIVKDIVDAPPGFLQTKKESALYDILGVNAAPSIQQAHSPPPVQREHAQCTCPQPIESVIPECPKIPQPQSTLETNLLANLSIHNSQLQKQLSEIQEDKKYLVDKLQTIGGENINKLKLLGVSDAMGSALLYTESVLREKLKINNFNIVKSAVRNEDGSIVFELNTLDDKLFVLRKSAEKLTNSKFSIIDY